MVEPLFFRDIVINCDSRYFSITQVKTQLAMLANKQCPASRYTRRLTIFSLSPGAYKGRPDLGNAVQENPMFAELDKCIKSALDALVSLRSVRYAIIILTSLLTLIHIPILFIVGTSETQILTRSSLPA